MKKPNIYRLPATLYADDLVREYYRDNDISRGGYALHLDGEEHEAGTLLYEITYRTLKAHPAIIRSINNNERQTTYL